MTDRPARTAYARIALDYTPAYEQGAGIGRCVRELTAALCRRADPFTYALFISGVQRDRPLPRLDDRFTPRPTPIPPVWWARLWGRARLPLPVETIVGAVDLYHATDFVLPPTRSHTRTLVTVHDLSFVRVPQTANPGLKAYLDAVVPRSVRRADQVLAVSAATKADLVELYGTPPDKIAVVFNGVEDRFQRVTDPAALAAVRTQYGLSERPFIFSVGTVQPRKNYARLIAALAELHRRGLAIDLVIAGGKGWLDDPIYAAIDQHDLREHVRFIGFAADADLPALYSAATVTALPSLYEGFGIPILESFACGTPVLTSNISALPEVAGDAAVLVDPLDSEAIADGLARLLTDSALREDLVTRGYTRAVAFSWDAAAAELAAIYRRWT